LYLLVIITLTPLLAGPAASLAEPGGKSDVIISGLTDTTGLVMDNRGNAYTVDKTSGQILYVPPGGAPMEYARIDGTPTVLAVNRLRTVFVGTESGAIHAILPDGTVSRVHACDSPVSGLSLDRDGNLFIATDKGSIIRIARPDLD
jgi:outer membrane protein assembly factor BamB